MINAEPVPKRRVHRFQRHLLSLIWKSIKQRKRRWRYLAAEVAFASICFLVVIFVARPVFLASPVIEGGATLTSDDILLSLNRNTEISYVPDVAPYNAIMERASQILDIDIQKAATVEVLMQRLRQKTKQSIIDPQIWVIWKQNENNIWKFSIQSTELARSQDDDVSVNTSFANFHHKHLHSGFLAVQLAISQAVVEQTAVKQFNYEVLLAAMPASPLMHHERVKRVISWVLLCFTAASLFPVLEAQALAVRETKCQLKRAFRMRNVDYSSMYIAWMVYAQMTMLPVCILASITLILTFRWIHFFTAFVFIFAYMCVMLMAEFIMGMFHHKVWTSCIWSAMVTILQTFIAELLIYHNYDDKHPVLVFLVNVLIPPLSLVHGFHQFALLQIGSGFAPRGAQPVLWIILSWLVMICLYFGILMLLQRTIADAYGGAISWKSIIFKHADNQGRIWRVEPVEASTWTTLQEVDDLMAKAVTFKNVYKSIMDVPIMMNITLDVYRGEYTKFYVEPSDSQMLTTMEDLITGLTYADRGSVNVLGKELTKNVDIMSSTYMMGYCHYFEFLMPELTVEEHIMLFAEITLWNESSNYVYEYTVLRMKHLFQECNLTEVAGVLVKNLSVYYQAQLCWTLAVLLEPRVVVVGKFKEDPEFGAVIEDKILKNKGHLTIIKMCYNTLKLQVADRVFLLDNKCLIFGGTPPYMFYKFGRDYRIRVTVNSIGGEDDTEELLERARAAGGTVRAHHGSMVVFRMPTQPTSNIAAFIRDITDNREKYRVSSFHLSLPDTEEVFMRAVTEFRALSYKRHERIYFKKESIKKICEPNVWRRQFSHCPNIHQIAFVFRKYFTFYITNKISLATTILSSFISGIVIGLLLTEVLHELSDDISNTKAIAKSNALTVESMDTKTNLILRADESEPSLSLANAYVLSEPNILEEHVKKLSYTALKDTENLANYLMIRSVDSPGEYLSLYAYGIDILNINDRLTIQALYNPLHYDTATAARSLARVYMALIRHYSNVRHATIEVSDDPLSLDLTSSLESTKRPPLFIEFMLIMTVAHATLVPSHEHDLIRHTQAHAMDFSPFRYWFTMFICDVVAMLLLLSVMTSSLLTVIMLNVPYSHYSYLDLVITPVMLFVYGVSCIPQAYLFSLGSRPGLNTMAYVTVNLVFGETIVISRYLYGKLLTVVLFAMNLSPQFNMAYGYVKIVKIFAYNSECLIFDDNKLCSSSFLHKCCPKSCGVMQECFQRKTYFSNDGVLAEIFSLTLTMFIFTGLLMLWEYKWLILLFNYVSNSWLYNGRMDRLPTSIGMIQEIREVRAKKQNLKKKSSANPFCLCQEDTFGEVLLVDDMTEKMHGQFELRNISFGIGKGEILALVGQTKHGRRRLCQLLAGVTLPSTGKSTLLNKWNVTSFKYMAHVSLSCESYSGPPWMRLRKVLEMLALFRGVPRKYIAEEAENFIEAMELHDVADMPLKKLLPLERSRANVAAALIAAPPLIILDEYVACQKFSVRRGLYNILNHLRKRGHGILLSASNVECHIPISKRLMILVNGYIYDIDYVNNLLARYSQKGFTVVVHLKNEIDVERVFSQYFDNFVINDTTDTLVNIQVLDEGLRCVDLFNKMELLQESNTKIYTYIISGTSIDYVYNSICLDDNVVLERFPSIPICCTCDKWKTKQIYPTEEMVASLRKYEQKYDITTLGGLPWSVVFQT